MPSINPERPGVFWRFGFGTTKEDRDVGWGENIPSRPSIEYLQELLDRKNPWDERIIIKEVLTSSRYRVRSAVAQNYWVKVGNCDLLLAGDAAHVHTPVGGQGLNLGVCEAVILGQTIKDHINAKQNGNHNPDQILERYAKSRYKVGCRVIGLTKRMTRMVKWGYGWRRIFRNSVMAILRRIPGSMKFLAWRMSGLVHKGA
ncbi:hypothetical protein M422DRAFT_254796 [Sphaerobolus stellatus SS14]|uniref:FAD-binding domain-containing protein n=1 Tax=Sphaerobolus stellatus (strain SS14) TaxID=990650 RepID=A0A0C9V5C2_SPHS4|nr:hypothetical protein M422DRAFT_254796 [Sphaerobolus stellatus SS14]